MKCPSCKIAMRTISSEEWRTYYIATVKCPTCGYVNKETRVVKQPTKRKY